ncbi:hypothetical protein NIES806_07880 [Dolichospermum compactum NIES-806]|uniref:Uncharacterized protein n=1 Tax=Dolichospermum compactum NIES-806 TaxID=1973481 RepID=A0A1Z4UZB7_9CYAN|nr:hypothetical protein NIES806_07880 [Dolichospermum compactum NIES-806]
MRFSTDLLKPQLIQEYQKVEAALQSERKVNY